MKAIVIGTRYYCGTTKKGNDLDGYFVGIAYDQKGTEGRAVDTKYIPKTVLNGLVPRPNMCLDIGINFGGNIDSVVDCTQK